MDIKKFIKKPQVIELQIDNEDIVKQVGEPITFYTKDYLDLSTYFDFYKLQENQNVDHLMTLLRKIVLDKDGNPALADDEILPIEITLAILNKVNEYLGKLGTKALVDPSGNEQN